MRGGLLVSSRRIACKCSIVSASMRDQSRDGCAPARPGARRLTVSRAAVRMRWTVEGARPLTFAIERTVQCVAVRGSPCSVRSTTAAIGSGEAAAKARPRGASRNRPPAPSGM